MKVFCKIKKLICKEIRVKQIFTLCQTMPILIDPEKEACNKHCFEKGKNAGYHNFLFFFNCFLHPVRDGSLSINHIY